MSRKGKYPIALPQGVEVNITGNVVKVKGPMGSLELEAMDCIQVKSGNNELTVGLRDGVENKGKFHGLYHALISNMVTGVSKGYKKTLKMIGVGYRAAVKGNILDVTVGLSHPAELPIPEGITVTVEKNTTIIISGIDKQLVGEFAATIRRTRPPEPYQGKGIRYEDEYVRKKAGKAASK